MPTECSPDRMAFARVDGRAVAAFDGGAITSDAGALLLGAADRAIGLVRRFSACFIDHRAPDQVEHSLSTLVGQRVLALALGDEDLVDHDTLRHAPVLAATLGRLSARRADCAPLAGKSTLNRLEHAPTGEPTRYHNIGHDGAAIERLFVDLFLDARTVPPEQIVLDLDATDDPRHGQQEGRFFHDYYGGYCYLPRYVFCGDHLLVAKLRRSNMDASAGRSSGWCARFAPVGPKCASSCAPLRGSRVTRSWSLRSLRDRLLRRRSVKAAGAGPMGSTMCSAWRATRALS